MKRYWTEFSAYLFIMAFFGITGSLAVSFDGLGPLPPGQAMVLGVIAGFIAGITAVAGIYHEAARFTPRQTAWGPIAMGFSAFFALGMANGKIVGLIAGATIVVTGCLIAFVAIGIQRGFAGLRRLSSHGGPPPLPPPFPD